ncbi:uncharacterized protein LOC121202666 [Betta splendens]|uniref:Uncharacterized protein LOC121202666 n=1 Tax=Betta splendens TaxID=158456 RepID=A0A8M1HLD9_BETSP|nr:uncharacterized protein LOC121202666 [Betta splendens]
MLRDTHSSSLQTPDLSASGGSVVPPDMSVSSSNDSHLHPPPSFASFELLCYILRPGCLVFTAFAFVSIFLLLPLNACVLHRGLQQWRRQRVSTAAMTTHSDIFTCHLAVMELISVFGAVLCVCGIYVNNFQLIKSWFYLSSITFYGETFFHILTCLELHLAVVHPIVYLSLREERWTRIRNIVIGCIWLLSCGWTGLITIGNGYLIPDVCLLITSVFIISFCSLSVLRALTRPGPGKLGRDPSKQRAFYSIAAILGVLLLRCSWSLVGAGRSVALGLVTDCLSNMCGVWISLPGSLLLPLMFMQRTGAFNRK